MTKSVGPSSEGNHTFESMKTGDTQKIDHLHQVEKSLEEKTTSFFSHPAYFNYTGEQVFTGKKIEGDTKPIADFFSGKAAYTNFIKSVANTQRRI